MTRILGAAFPALAVLGFGLVASCTDATGPQTGVTVSVIGVNGPSYPVDSSGLQLIHCGVTLLARNAHQQSAVWLDATVAFYSPNDSRTPIAVDTVSAAAIRSSWGSDSITEAHDDTARWDLLGSIPFSMTIRFAYRISAGSIASSTVSVSCQPTTPPGHQPTIIRLQDQQDTAPEPGDTLHVSYAATSVVGLWQSIIHVAGACDTAVFLPEHLQFGVTHDVAVSLPAACRLGVPVSVTAEAFDARLQEDSQFLTLPALVDHRPPRLYASVTTPYNQATPVASFAGFVFTGDVISLLVTAIDNHALHGFYWEVLPAGPRDSVLASDSAVFRTVTIPVQTSWVGTIQLRLYATDALGNVSDTLATSNIQVAPTVGPAPILTSISGDITDVLFDEKRGVVYLLQSNSYKIAVFSPANLTILDTIPLSDYASGFDLSPSGDSLVAVLKNSQAIGIVDLTQASPVLQTIPLASLDSSYLLNIKVASTGRAVIAAQSMTGVGKLLYTYDLANGTLRLRPEVPDLGYEASGQLGRSTDGRTIVVNGEAGAFVQYDALSDSFGPALTAQIPDWHPSLDSTGARIAVSGDLYDASLQYLHSVTAATSGPQPAEISPDGQTHYMAIGPGVVRSRVSDGSLIDRISAPLLITLLRVSPDGSTLAAVENCCGEVRIGLINLQSLSPINLAQRTEINTSDRVVRGNEKAHDGTVTRLQKPKPPRTLLTAVPRSRSK